MLPKSRLARAWNRLARKPMTHIIWVGLYETKQQARQRKFDCGQARPGDKFLFLKCAAHDEVLPPDVLLEDEVEPAP
jgi:hypothetical protein